jgi:uncharacterized protein (TIGR01244 family)
MKAAAPGPSRIVGMSLLAFAPSCFLALLLANSALPQNVPAWAQDLKVAPVAVGQVKNSSAFGDRIYFAAQPGEGDFAEYARLGVKTVVNLRTAAEMEKAGIAEKELSSKAGLQYHQIAFGSQPPAPEDLARIFDILGQAGDAKVLLHCASSNRVGFVWGLYRNSRHGLSPEAALGEAKAAGLTSPALEKLLRERLQSKGQ